MFFSKHPFVSSVTDNSPLRELVAELLADIMEEDEIGSQKDGCSEVRKIKMYCPLECMIYFSKYHRSNTTWKVLSVHKMNANRMPQK